MQFISFDTESDLCFKNDTNSCGHLTDLGQCGGEQSLCCDFCLECGAR